MKKYGENYEQPTAVPMINPGYNLPAKYVIHIVGPIVTPFLMEKQKMRLAECYRASLAVAAEHDCKSIAFCCISTGVFMFIDRFLLFRTLQLSELILIIELSLVTRIFRVCIVQGEDRAGRARDLLLFLLSEPTIVRFWKWPIRNEKSMPLKTTHSDLKNIKLRN